MPLALLIVKRQPERPLLADQRLLPQALPPSFPCAIGLGGAPPSNTLPFR